MIAEHERYKIDNIDIIFTKYWSHQIYYYEINCQY